MLRGIHTISRIHPAGPSMFMIMIVSVCVGDIDIVFFVGIIKDLLKLVKARAGWLAYIASYSYSYIACNKLVECFSDFLAEQSLVRILCQSMRI